MVTGWPGRLKSSHSCEQRLQNKKKNFWIYFLDLWNEGVLIGNTIFLKMAGSELFVKKKMNVIHF